MQYIASYTPPGASENSSQVPNPKPLFTKDLIYMMKKLFARASVGAIAMMGSAAAMASNASGDQTFKDFRDTVLNWAQGPLGTGLSITMMLMGAGMGVARNSPMPALSGIAGAAFLNWGPGIIKSLTEGALI